MVTFSLILLVCVTLLIPLVGVIVYSYIKDQGWVPLALGMSYMGLTILAVRMILPAFLYHYSWFVDLVANRSLFAVVYALSFTLVLFGLTWLAFRFNIKKPDISRAVVFGFGQGLFYEALYVGFNGLSAMLSSNVAAVNEEQLGGVYLAMLEAVCILILYSGFSCLFYIGRKQKKPLFMAAYPCLVFLMMYLGSAWMEIWHLPRLLLELLMAAAAAGMGCYLYRNVPWKTFFKNDQPEEEEEDLEFLESLERLKEETASSPKNRKS